MISVWKFKSEKNPNKIIYFFLKYVKIQIYDFYIKILMNKKIENLFINYFFKKISNDYFT